MIREARLDEAELLSALAFRSKAYWGYSHEFMTACREELTLSRAYLDEIPTFVSEHDGQVIGFYTLEPRSSGCVELGHLFVEPREIGCGHGRLLFDHAIAEARRRGYREMSIQADPNAEAFYRECGARRVGERPSASVPERALPLLELDLFADPDSFCAP